MKNASVYSMFLTASLGIFLLFPGEISAQSVKRARFTVAPLDNNIRVVSTRIASIYGADEQVVESFVQTASDFEARTGVAAAIVIAIAIHESSFNSYLFSKTGNPFGIKAGKPWVGPTFSKNHDGKKTPFRVYSSVEEAVLDFGNFVKSRV